MTTEISDLGGRKRKFSGDRLDIRRRERGGEGGCRQSFGIPSKEKEKGGGGKVSGKLDVSSSSSFLLLFWAILRRGGGLERRL